MSVFQELLKPYTPSKGECGKCPRCGYEQFCPHEKCVHPKNAKPYLWTKDGDHITCTCCGFTAHADFWETWDIECAYLDPNSAFNKSERGTP